MAFYKMVIICLWKRYPPLFPATSQESSPELLFQRCDASECTCKHPLLTKTLLSKLIKVDAETVIRTRGWNKVDCTTSGRENYVRVEMYLVCIGCQFTFPYPSWLSSAIWCNMSIIIITHQLHLICLSCFPINSHPSLNKMLLVLVWMFES